MIYLMSWKQAKPAKMTEKEPEMVPFSFMVVVGFEIELYFAAKCINLVENKADYVARHYKFSSYSNVYA